MRESVWERDTKSNVLIMCAQVIENDRGNTVEEVVIQQPTVRSLSRAVWTCFGLLLELCILCARILELV